MNALEAVATMVNTLDTSIFERRAREDVIWESQSVLGDLRGKETVLDYLNGKYETIRRTKAYPVAQLACNNPRNYEDCFVVEQLGSCKSTTFVKADGRDQIMRIDVCFIPSPAQVIKTGRFPKLTLEEVNQRRHAWIDVIAERIQFETDPIEVRGYFMEQSQGQRVYIEEVVQKAAELLPGAMTEICSVGVDAASNERARDDSVDGFPCIAIRKGGTLIWPGGLEISLDKLSQHLHRVGLA